jgi:hypothetical protein
MNWATVYQPPHRERLETIARCYFECEQGWTDVAIRRLEEALARFPNDPQALFALGQVKEQFAGQGLAARELFERAWNADNAHPLAAGNMATLARDEKEFHLWADRAMRRPAWKDDFPMIELIFEILSKQNQYEEAVMFLTQIYGQNNAQGQNAALLEVILSTPIASRDEEKTQLLRGRAMSLRQLDRRAEMARNARQEAFLADERVTLRAAIAALDSALALDPYDAELWNFKSAWSILIGEHQVALTCADKALALRPTGYPKPHQNKAAAFRGLKRWEEARESARTAGDIGASLGPAGAEDVSLAENSLRDIDRDAGAPDRTMIEAHLIHVAGTARLTAHKMMDIAPVNLESVAVGVSNRLMRAGPGWTGSCIPVLAELLHDMMPEVCVEIALILGQRARQSPKIVGDAAIYLAMRATGVMQRDAARFIALRMMWVDDGTDAAETLQSIRETYRTVILVRSAALGLDCSLADAVGDALRRLSPILFTAIAEQAPISDAEIAAARPTLTDRFSEDVLGTPSPVTPPLPGKSGGAAFIWPLVPIILMALAWLMFH